MISQRSLKSSVSDTGVGLHTGKTVGFTLRPAPVGTGIVFRRTDLNPVVDVPAVLNSVSSTRMSTTLQRDGISISTVEHLMSAFAALAIDNVFVDLTAPEVPIMDGSAYPFVFLMESAGIVNQAAPKQFIRIKQPLEIRDGEKWARFEPFDGFKVNLTIEFEHPEIQASPQYASIDFSQASFVKDFSRARTFGFLREVEALQEIGLARGGSLDNAIVMDDFRILNSDGLRYPDEFVKHKILDAVGDLYLLGHLLVGSFSAHKSGHSLNNGLLRRLLETEDAWEYISYDDVDTPAVRYLQLLTAH